MSKFTKEKPVLDPEDQYNLDNNLTATVAYGSIEEIPDILSKGANINYIDAWGRTALKSAVEKKDQTLINFLLNEGADPNRTNKGSNTALMIAASNDDAEAIKSLTKAKANVNATNSYGDTALIYAADLNHLTALKALLNEGADPNLKNKKDDTALMIAAKQGQGYSKIVKTLIEGGADVKGIYDIYNNGWTYYVNSTPKIHAIFINHKEDLNEIASIIQEESTRTTPLSDYELNSDERKNLVIDATNFNKDNIIEALVYKIAKDQVEAGKTPKTGINTQAEKERIQAIHNSIYNPDTPDQLQAITATVNKVLVKYRLEREQNQNKTRLISTVAQTIPEELTANISSHLHEEQIGSKRSERGAFKAGPSNKKSRGL